MSKVIPRKRPAHARRSHGKSVTNLFRLSTCSVTWGLKSQKHICLHLLFNTKFEADTNVFSSVLRVFSHKTKVLVKIKFLPDNGARWSDQKVSSFVEHKGFYCNSSNSFTILIFHSNPKSIIRRIVKVIGTHPLGTMNVCTKLHGNPSHRDMGYSVWTKVLDRLTVPFTASFHMILM